MPSRDFKTMEEAKEFADKVDGFIYYTVLYDTGMEMKSYNIDLKLPKYIAKIGDK